MEYNAGTIIKMNVSMEYGGTNMDGFWFQLDFFTKEDGKVYQCTKPVEGGSLPLTKRIDANNYVAFIDTTDMPTGRLKMKVIASITDLDNPNTDDAGKSLGRKLIKTYPTNIIIRNE